MKKFALLDLIKFHELENEKEQTKFIKKGDEHFINLLKMITNRLLKTGTKQKQCKYEKRNKERKIIKS